MKLNELTRTTPIDTDVADTAKQYYTEHPSQYDPDNPLDGGEAVDTGLNDRMKELGWKHIGYGSFSSVFANPSKPYILKVNIAYDRAFAWFALLTRKFKNRHFPSIGDARLLVIGKKKYYIYLVEKLVNIDPEDGREVADFCRLILKGHNPAWYLEKKFPKQEDSLRNACSILRKYKKNLRIDMHFNNIMKRTNGTIVIIDPFAEKTTSEKENEKMEPF